MSEDGDRDHREPGRLVAELEDLRAQNSIFVKDSLAVKSAHKNILALLVQVQGLLYNLSLDRVRDDFLAGRFKMDVNCSVVLKSLDLLRPALLLRPDGFDVDRHNGNIEEALSLIAGFFSSEPGEPIVGGEVLPGRRTFSEWRKLFIALMDSEYWSQTSEGTAIKPESSRVSDAVSGKKGENKPEASPTQIKIKPERYSRSREYSLTDRYRSPERRGYSTRRERSHSRRSRHRSHRHDSHGSRRHRRTRDRSGDHHSRSRRSRGHSRRGSSSHSSRSCSRSPRAYRRQSRSFSPKGDESVLVTALKNLSVRREAVPPALFSSSNGESLRKSFSSFERYFNSKYTGDERDMSRQLSKYLDGTLQGYYEAMGGRSRRYRDVKAELLRMHRANRDDEHEANYRRFQDLKMLPKDTVHMYAVRLERAADRAFRSKTEADRQLCRKMWDTAPSFFLEKLKVAHGALSAFGHKKISWSRIMKMAAGAELGVPGSRSVGASRDDPEVWYSRPSAAPDAGYSSQWQSAHKGGTLNDAVSSKQPLTRVHSGEFRRSKPSGNAAHCGWCGKPGHMEQNCCLKLKLCFNCREPGHQRENCPRLVQGQSEGVSQPSTWTPGARGQDLGTPTVGTPENP